MNSYYKWLYGNKCGCNDRGGTPKGNCTCDQIFSAITEIQNEINSIDLSEYWTSAETVSAITEIVYDALDDLELELDEKEQVVSEALHYLYHNKAEASAVTELQTAVEELNTEIDELDLDNKEKVVSEALHYLYHNKAEESAVTELQTAVEELNTEMDELDFDNKEKTLAEALHYLYHNKLDASASTDFVTDAELSAYTYDKSTIDEKISEGGVFDPTQYYNKTATDALLADKLDASAYTPTDLTNYDTKSEVNTKISTATALVNSALTAHTADTSVHVTASEKATWNAKSNFSGSYNDLTDKPTIPTVPTSNTAFTNDAGYITSAEAQSAITAATSGLQETLSAGTNVSITNNVISATDTTYTAGDNITISNQNVISTVTKFWCGDEAAYNQIAIKDINTIYLVHN